jgi:hypothetical protein
LREEIKGTGKKAFVARPTYFDSPYIVNFGWDSNRGKTQLALIGRNTKFLTGSFLVWSLFFIFNLTSIRDYNKMRIRFCLVATRIKINYSFKIGGKQYGKTMGWPV